MLTSSSRPAVSIPQDYSQRRTSLSLISKLEDQKRNEGQREKTLRSHAMCWQPGKGVQEPRSSQTGCRIPSLPKPDFYVRQRLPVGLPHQVTKLPWACQDLIKIIPGPANFPRSCHTEKMRKSEEKLSSASWQKRSRRDWNILNTRPGTLGEGGIYYTRLSQRQSW